MTYLYMAKKCIPGFMCVDTMVLFFAFLFLLLAFYYFLFHFSPATATAPIINISTASSSAPDSLTNIYNPPLSAPPIYRTSSFSQIGILVKNGDENNQNMILPLMGRYMNRDKWQYYTTTNTGVIQSKLTLKINGKDGMQEYGVNEIYNGDSVLVDGYNEIFSATIYENRGLSYSGGFL